jgi:UDP-N-acetylglucosamine:LPS N-acetylglucosamine transferase
MQRTELSSKPRVLVISGSVGAGHDGAAAELVARLRGLGITVNQRDYLDALPRRYGFLLRKGYSGTVNYLPYAFDWVFRNLEGTSWVRRLADRLCGLAKRKVLDWSNHAEVVVSTYPLASQTLGQLKMAGQMDATLVTFLTDPSVHHTWVHPAVDMHLTVTEATAVMGQRCYGTTMLPVGGLVPARFAATVPLARRNALRAELGLSPDGAVVLVVAGSLGLGDVPRTVRAIQSGGSSEVLVLCGRNERLRRRLERYSGVVALGWRDDVAELMAAADLLVHNAGGLSVTEALTAGLPVVTFRPISGHGQANAAVLEQAGLAPWPRDETQLTAEISRCLARERRDASSVHRIPDAARVVSSLLAPTSSAARSDPADAVRPQSA